MLRPSSVFKNHLKELMGIEYIFTARSFQNKISRVFRYVIIHKLLYMSKHIFKSRDLENNKVPSCLYHQTKFD